MNQIGSPLEQLRAKLVNLHKYLDLLAYVDSDEADASAEATWKLIRETEAQIKAIAC